MSLKNTLHANPNTSSIAFMFLNVSYFLSCYKIQQKLKAAVLFLWKMVTKLFILNVLITFLGKFENGKEN